MPFVLQLIINGIIAGAIYALIASGFSLIYNVKKFLHIAHGGIFAVSAFTAWYFTTQLGLNIFLSFGLTLIIAVFLGILIDRIVYQPLDKVRNREFALLIASFGVFIFLESLMLLLFGADVKSFGFPVTRGHDFFGAIVTNTQILIIISTVIIFILLQIFLKKTRTGKSLRAAADNKDIASTLGININKTTTIAFAIGSILAAVAGVLVGIEQNIEHTMGFMAIIKGIIAAIIGGIGNVPAGIFGGFFLGIVENIGIWFLPSGWKDAITFVILIIFLLFRPRGFFSARRREL